MDHAHKFQLSTEYIELYKLLKIFSLVGSGAEAKQVVAEGLVLVNGTVETRKRYKARSGDRVGFEGQTIDVVAAASQPEEEAQNSTTT